MISRAASVRSKDGTPAHDHLGDILAPLDAGQFQACIVAWAAAVTGVLAGVIAIDGKTARRSGKTGSAKAAVHMVSAFAARQRLVLGQVKVTEKTNETVAIPKLLDMMAIEGAIITIDAMGCQRDIAQKAMDMLFRDNECRVRTDHAPAHFTTIKHMPLNLLRTPAGKQSLRGRRKAAGSDNDFLASPVAA